MWGLWGPLDDPMLTCFSMFMGISRAKKCCMAPKFHKWGTQKNMSQMCTRKILEITNIRSEKKWEWFATTIVISTWFWMLVNDAQKFDGEFGNVAENIFNTCLNANIRLAMPFFLCKDQNSRSKIGEFTINRKLLCTYVRPSAWKSKQRKKNVETFWDPG